MRETDDEQIVRELTEFMRSYEAANNSHEVDRVLPFIASEASYWFSDGSHYGHAQIRLALGTTFETIQEERYTITELVWVCVRVDAAVCRYVFSWTGSIDGHCQSGKGRGTNVFARDTDGWKIVHEQLTADR